MMTDAPNQPFLDLFVEVDTPDPHTARRRAILARHPEVKQLIGFDPRTKWVILFAFVLQMGLAAWVGLHGTLGVTLLAAYLVGCPLNNWIGSGMHEVGHGLATRSARGARLLGMFANLPLVVPAFATGMRYHRHHHHFLGTEEKDNDLPSAFEVRHFDGSRTRRFLWLFCYWFFAATSRSFADWKGHRDPLDAAQRWNIASQILFSGLVVWALGGHALLYLFLSAIFVFGVHPAGFFLVQQHYQFDGERQETNSYYGFWNLLSFNLGCHTEHHDFPNIPGLRLGQLKKLAPEFYEGRRSHRSYLACMWQFVMDPRMGHHARIVRRFPQHPFPQVRPLPADHRMRRTA